MICFLDIDGVLADFVQGVARLFGVSYQSLLNQESWAIYKALGASEDEMWNRIEAAGPTFWEMLEPYPWLVDLVRAVEERFGFQNVYLLTSPGPSVHAPSGKVKWVRTHLPSELHTRVIISMHKTLIARNGYLLIDDNDANCDAWRNAGGLSILFPQPWNRMRAVGHDRIVRTIRKWPIQ